MNKRGFTLVELLAVLVVLGVIAMIAVPVTVNLISDSRKNTFKNSVNGMIQSVEIYSTKVAGSATTLDLSKKEDIGKLDYSGADPTSGTVFIDEDGMIYIFMCNEKYCGYRRKGEKEITILDKNSTECQNIINSSSKEKWLKKELEL
jgi:type IV pilus assembly protein PilA